MKALAFELERVFARRGETQVAKNLSLQVAPGEVVCLLGPSGSGKSSLLRLILGLSLPDSGLVRIGGKTASDARRLLIAPEDRGLGAIFQHLALWPHLTVAGNLEYALRAARLPKAERAARIEEMLYTVGLADCATRRPHTLSGGEQQRVALARALVARPAALLLDEPLSSLDGELKAELLELLQGVLKQHQVAALYVTHAPMEAQQLAQRWLVMDRGELIYDGSCTMLPAASDNSHLEYLKQTVCRSKVQCRRHPTLD